MTDQSKRQFLQHMMAAAMGLGIAPASFSAANGDKAHGEKLWPSIDDLSTPVSDAILPSAKPAARFKIHNRSPWGLETARSSFGIGPITPRANFFVRNNLPMPDPDVINDADAWSFDVQGTAREGQMTLAELKQLPSVTVAAVIQCSGNGRAFFPHKPSGSPWGVGAAGCALWTGVPIAAVAEKLGGVIDDAQFLTAAGGDARPEGVVRDQVVVERSVPLAKGLEDGLLVWEMNGAPLDLVHGGPLRLLVPGYFGVNNVKWVRQLRFTPGESGARIQTSGYRLRAIGSGGSPEHPSMWRMPVKSWLNGPGADGTPVRAGSVTVYGYALAGERGVASVEVAALTDDKTLEWQRARFVGPDLGPNAWRAFAHELTIKPGQHCVVSRATDSEGERQPRERRENHRGYGHNGWYDHALSITVTLDGRSALGESGNQSAAPVASGLAVTASRDLQPDGVSQSLALSVQAQLGKEVFVKRAVPACGTCHTLADANTRTTIGPNLDELRPSRAQTTMAVSQGVGAMPPFADALSAEEIAALSAYIEESAGRQQHQHA